MLDDDRVNPTELLRILADRTPAATSEVVSNDLPFKLARALTAPFIVADEYGTRCSTTVLVSNDGRIEFFERRFDKKGNPSGESGFRFDSE